MYFFKYFLLIALSFLKQKQKIKKTLSKEYFLFFNLIFFYKFFWKKSIKIALYLNFFNKSLTCFSKKFFYKSLLFIVNRKKGSYVLTLIKEGALLITVTLGTVLKYLRIEGKVVKKTKKGFKVFLNIFKKIFLKFSNNFFKKNIFLNFFNFYLVFFFKQYKFIFEKKAKIFLNLNLNQNKNSFKKVKGIKKRILKRKIKVFLQDWKSLTKKTFLTPTL